MAASHTIRFPPYLYEALKATAKVEGVSFNLLVITLLTQALAQYRAERD